MKNYNKESVDLLNDYILELKSKGRSAGTIKQYKGDINKFYKWVYEELDNVSILELKRKSFRNYFLLMQEDNMSSARINRFMSSIRNLLEYAVTEDDSYPNYQINAMKQIKSLEKIPTKEITFLTNEQVEFLISYLVNNNKLQQGLYLSLSYDSACRRAEALQVDKYSFMDNTSFMTNEVTSKGNKKYNLMYSSYTRELAQKHLEQRDDDVPSLFITNKKNPRPVSYNTLYQWSVGFNDILEAEYGEKFEISSHMIRHFSLENYENGTHRNLKSMGIKQLDLDMLKVLANHSDISTTQSYLKNKDSDLLRNLFDTN